MQHTLNSQPDTPPAPIRALVLDDDAFDRSRIRRVTERSDLVIEVDEVPTIAEMSASIQTAPYDVILVDYNLTDGNGFDAIQRIRTHDRSRDTAVIMVTGQGRGHLVADAFHSGCQDFIEKQDISPVTFRNIVLKAMERVRFPQNRIADLDWRGHLQAAFRDPEIVAELRTAISQSLRDLTHTALPAPRDDTDDLIAGMMSPDSFDFQS